MRRVEEVIFDICRVHEGHRNKSHGISATKPNIKLEKTKKLQKMLWSVLDTAKIKGQKHPVYETFGLSVCEDYRERVDNPSSTIVPSHNTIKTGKNISSKAENTSLMLHCYILAPTKMT